MTSAAGMLAVRTIPLQRKCLDEHRFSDHIPDRRRLTGHRGPIDVGRRSVARSACQRGRGLRMHSRHRPSHARRDYRSATLLHTSALAFQALKYVGVPYLLYMAWTTLKEHGALRIESEGVPRSNAQVVVSAILVNVMNPKLSIFFFAFLPQFVRVGETNPVPRMLELSLAFMVMTFIVFVGYGVCAASVRNHVTSRPRVLAWM